MATLEKISTLDDMKQLMSELHRLEAKFLFDFYGVLSDFSSKKLLPAWLQKKSVSNVVISESGKDILMKVTESKRISVVVYDLETRDCNGLQFLAALEKNPNAKANCKVILAIPKLPLDVQTKLLHLGAFVLVEKPLSEEGLQAVFEKIGFTH